MSGSEEHELGALDSDANFEDDEETGLNKDERQKYLKRKRIRDGLDARIAGTARLSQDEAKEADKSVLHRLLVNAGLIGLWYLFSLSISIVSLLASTPTATTDGSPVQQDDVLLRPHRFPLSTVCNIPPYGGPILSGLDHPPHISFSTAFTTAATDVPRRVTPSEASGDAVVLFYSIGSDRVNHVPGHRPGKYFTSLHHPYILYHV